MRIKPRPTVPVFRETVYTHRGGELTVKADLPVSKAEIRITLFDLVCIGAINKCSIVWDYRGFQW